jgi:hypothetical protein
MHITTPWRRMILQLSQRVLTDAETFMVSLLHGFLINAGSEFLFSILIVVYKIRHNVAVKKNRQLRKSHHGASSVKPR